MVHKLDFYNTGTDILRVCVYLLLIEYMTKFKTVFRGLIFWRYLLLPPIALNKNNRQILVFYSTRSPNQYVNISMPKKLPTVNPVLSGHLKIDKTKKRS